MAGIQHSDEEIIPLSEETLDAACGYQDSVVPFGASEIVPNTCGPHPLDEIRSGQLVPQSSRLSHRSEENCLQPYSQSPSPSFHLSNGNFEKSTFGPVTKNKHIQANNIEHATIINHHHHYPAEQTNDDEYNTCKSGRKSTEKGIGNETEETHKIPKGYVMIFEDTYMYTKRPIRMGNVFKGYQIYATEHKHDVAIKKLTIFERRLKKIETLMTLSHQNIIRILLPKVLAERTGKQLFIVMELCKEDTLEDYLDDIREGKKPFELARVISIAQQLIDAVAHFHCRNIIHGNLKPKSILFAFDGKEIKVSSFRVMKQLQDSNSLDGYGAPESYSSGRFLRSADIYSLGIILYSLFARGGHPFGENSDLWKHNMKNNTFSLSGLAVEMGTIAEDLKDLLRKIFQLDPQKRPTIEMITKHQFSRALMAQEKEGLSSPAPRGAALNSEAAFTHPKELLRSVANAQSTPIHATPQRCNAEMQSLSTLPKSPRCEDHPAAPRCHQRSNANLLGTSTHQSQAAVRPSAFTNFDQLEWHVTGVHFDSVIRDIQSGCRISCKPEQNILKVDLHQSIKLNQNEVSSKDIDNMPIPLPWSLQLCPGIVVWSDHDTSSLFAFNLCHEVLKLKFCDKCQPGYQFSVLPSRKYVKIFSFDKFMKFVEAKDNVSELPEVIFALCFSVSKQELFRITPHLRLP